MSGASDTAALLTGAAADSPSYEPPVDDWTLRPFAAPSRSPWRVAAALGLGFVAISQGIRLAMSGPGSPTWTLEYLWLDLLNGVLFAYMPTALWLLRRGRMRALQELRPHLRQDVAYARVADSAVRVRPGVLTLASLAAAFALGSIPAVDTSFWDVPKPGLAHPIMLFFVVRMAATGWLGGRALATEATALAAFARIAARDVRVDLLDLRPFAIFSRIGLRSALAWVPLSSLISLFWLGPGAPAVNAVIVVTILGGVSLGFYACIEGAHRAIAAAKREALAEVEDRLRVSGPALLTGPVPEADGARVADLVAWHGFLERIRDWPVDAPALARGALIAALGLGSWLGGALVDRLLDRVFG